MAYKIFIDGKEGTTGLQIYQRFEGRKDLELLLLDDENRKDINARREMINASDITFLCLPDAAAVEAVALIDNPETRVIDASTAHRTAPGWDYGFAELSPARREAIACSKRVANPGCHASGFISSVYPLVQGGIVPADFMFACSSLTGYTGGGKKLRQGLITFGNHHVDIRAPPGRGKHTDQLGTIVFNRLFVILIGLFRFLIVHKHL